MQWFKHMSNMSFDPKIKRIIRKYGAEGYGLYCYTLESIARGLSETSPIPDFEESSEDIAADLKMDSRRVEEIMMYMVHQGLFDWHDAQNRIVCMKMVDYLDEYHRKNGKQSNIRKALEAIELRHCPDKLLTDSGDVAKNREDKEEKRIEEEKPKRSRFAPPTTDEIIDYCNNAGYSIDAERFHDFYASKGWMIGKNKMKDWKAAVRTWARKDAENNPQKKLDTAYSMPQYCKQHRRELIDGKCPMCEEEKSNDH